MTRKTMQAVLDSLESFERSHPAFKGEFREEREMLRTALAEPEQELQWCECGDGYPPSEFDANGDCPNCQRTEPVQEPVAWKLNIDINNYQGQSEYRTVLAFRPDPAVTGNYEVNEVISAQPLYTHPKREWVGLTDLDIVLALQKHKVTEMPEGYETVEFEIARAIEAKLKEKNT